MAYGICPRCGSDDPRGLRIGCDKHAHPYHDRADDVRREVEELEEMLRRSEGEHK